MTGTWREALAALDVPPGVPGSGRQRYGAAMTLWREGLIPPDVLEIYRVASALDGQDPVPMLAAAGLPRPGSEIAALVAASRELIASRSFAGQEDVLAGLALAQMAQPDPGPNAVVSAHLAHALAVAERGGAAGPVVAAVGAAAPWLHWITYDIYPLEEIGGTFATSHAFAALALGDDFELGVFLVAPGVFYRDRAHAAPEMYVPLTGPHGWRFAPGTALERKPALEPVWNPPHQPHATLVSDVPFLCLYAWTRDTSDAAYVLPSSDWDRIEAGT